MNVTAFEATCLNCGNMFPCPKLPDSSYGDIILNCECGKEFAYHSMVSHPVTLIFNLLRQIHKIDLSNHSLADFSAHFADTTHFHHFTTRQICSICKSDNLSVNVSQKMGSWDIQTASFEKLYSLSIDEIFKKFSE